MSTLQARRRAHEKRYQRVQASGLCHHCEQAPRVTSRFCRPCQDRVSGLARQRYRRSDYGAAFTVAVIQAGQAVSQRGWQ
jgi:hypothetical protein